VVAVGREGIGETLYFAPVENLPSLMTPLSVVNRGAAETPKKCTPLRTRAHRHPRSPTSRVACVRAMVNQPAACREPGSPDGRHARPAVPPAKDSPSRSAGGTVSDLAPKFAPSRQDFQ
jgi:hypothetical protein